MYRSLAIIAGGLLLGVAPAAAEDHAATVIELFTSEGCSSCPPADAYFGELAKRSDVIALSYHVDYWDYLGWKDSYASKIMTERQRAYGQSLGSNYVYTPQMVIGGAADAVGSDRVAVNRAIALREKSAVHIPLAVSQAKDGKLIVEVPSAKTKHDAVLWLIRYDSKHSVAIEHGENSGSTLTYYNVVRNIEKLGSWNGQATKIDVDPATLSDADHALVLLQTDGTGPILGYARLPDRSGS
ncbi:MAG TPA: DUF1223 domain-containing protein [Candidatus Sulfotelmatobacter sp.]|nr:DUF1223 domain-containing protein [Candidatus Sulfotelmatobacter sp.]